MVKVLNLRPQVESAKAGSECGDQDEFTKAGRADDSEAKAGHWKSETVSDSEEKLLMAKLGNRRLAHIQWETKEVGSWMRRSSRSLWKTQEPSCIAIAT